MAEATASQEAEKLKLKHSWAEDLMGVVTGVAIASIGLFFLKSAGVVTGGTAGLSLLVSYWTNLPVSWMFPAVNLPFFVLAVWKKGWVFTLRTVACVVVVGFLADFHLTMMDVDMNPIYGAVCGNLLCGVGLLILFRHKSSLGGINILALIMQERAGISAGYFQMGFDVVIVALSLFVTPWYIVILSACGAVLLNLVLAFNHRPGRYMGY